ncbi:Transposable element Tc1 transposase, partial [Stegodyphus mimosarum]
MTQRTHLDDFLRGRIIGRLECGCTQLEVSNELRIAQSVISRLWQQFRGDGNVSRRYSTGRPRVTTPNEDRYLAVTAKRNRRSTVLDLSRQLSSAIGTTISRYTVYRRLGQIGLYACRPVRCIPLTATHCRLRLAWSREHALWTPQQWACVMFSDESRFSLQFDSRRTFLWRAPVVRVALLASEISVGDTMSFEISRKRAMAGGKTRELRDGNVAISGDVWNEVVSDTSLVTVIPFLLPED